MGYETIDPVIDGWVARHRLHLVRRYKDYEVRSVDVQVNGTLCQLWIDPVVNGVTTIHVWPYKDPHERWELPIEQIDSGLEHALQRAHELLSR
jgi:hypothetical protein